MDDAWRAVGALSAWQVTASFCYYATFGATQFLPGTFAVSPFLVGVVVTAATLGYTLFLFPAGATADGFGEKRVLVGGLAGLAAGATGVALADSYPVLLAAAFALGAVYATAMPGTNRAIVGRVPPERRNVAMGVKQVGVTAGGGASALVVAWFAATPLGWRGGFAFAAAVAVGVAAAFGVAYSGTAGEGRLRPPDVGSLAAAPGYRPLVLAGAFLGAALFTTTGYATLYVHDGVGASHGVAGLVFALAMVAGSAGRIAAGGVADWLAADVATAAGRVLTAQAAAAAGLFLVVAGVDSVPGVVVAFALLGTVALGFTGVYYSCLAAVVPDDAVGAATAGGQVALNAGALLAPPAFGALVDAAGYPAGWAALAACCLAATVVLAVGAPG